MFRSGTPPWYHEHRGSGLNSDKVYGRGRSPSPPPAGAAFQLPQHRATEDRVLATHVDASTMTVDDRSRRPVTGDVTADQTDRISRRLRVHKTARSAAHCATKLANSLVNFFACVTYLFLFCLICRAISLCDTVESTVNRLTKGQ